jgi:hypothetical protein
LRRWPSHVVWTILGAVLCAMGGCAGDAWVTPPENDGSLPEPGWELDDDPADGGEIPTVVSDITASVTLGELVPTVALVEWTLGNVNATRTYVQVGPTPAYDRSVDGECADGVCWATVLGLKASTVYHWRVVAVTEAGLVGTANAFFATGAAPSGLATLTLDHLDEERSSDGYLLTTLVGVPATTVIVDDEGDYVWWYRHGDGDHKVIRAHFSRDGEWILLLVETADDGTPPTASEFVRVRLDGSEIQIVPMVDVRHDFLELPNGTILFLAYDVWLVDGKEIVGDGLVEMSADGDTQQVWSIWEHAAYHEDLHDLPGDSWAHANALQYDEASGLVLLSLRNLDSIFAIDCESGDVRWRFGGEHSDFKLESGSEVPFEEQHQFHLFDDRLVVFDNGTSERSCSRAVEFEMGDGTDVVREVWSHEADPCLFVYALGDVRRLEDGNTMVMWSTAGQAEQVSADGDVAWRLNSSLGWGFGYASWLPTLGEDPAP